MAVFKHRLAFEVAPDIKAFLNLDAGITRGSLPDSTKYLSERRAQSRLKDKQERIRLLREQLAADRREIDRLHQLVHKQSMDTKRKLAQLDRQRFEAASLGEISRPNGQGSFLKTDTATELYLDLMKRCLKHEIYDEPQVEGSIWPTTAHTMIGHDSLDALQFCVEDVLAKEVAGDLIETGVWRGGATILMRAILKAYGVEDRYVWVADSFEGLPPPNLKKYPHDKGSTAHTAEELAVSVEQVKSNFERYGLLDDQVRFLKGWFRDTLPEAPIEQLAVARLDGDMYESTMDALVNLYPKLSIGGYVIIDDYGAVPACRRAVHDFREAWGINEEMDSIDWSGVYWQRTE